MRPAFTIGKTPDGWVVLHGPDSPREAHRETFSNLAKYPKGVDEMYFCDSFKKRDRAHYERIQKMLTSVVADADASHTPTTSKRK